MIYAHVLLLLDITDIHHVCISVESEPSRVTAVNLRVAQDILLVDL